MRLTLLMLQCSFLMLSKVFFGWICDLVWWVFAVLFAGERRWKMAVLWWLFSASGDGIIWDESEGCFRGVGRLESAGKLLFR